MRKRIKLPEGKPGEILYKALIQNAHEGVVLYDKGGKIKFASHSVKKVVGYPEKELIGKGGTYFVHPDDAEETRSAFFKLLKKPGKSITLFQRLKHRKGHYIWAESLLTNFLHVPEINGVVSNFRDITERKKSDQEIHQARELL